jgi:two-component system chemotaxis response regulator CheB
VIRVLVVDDSGVARRMLTQILSTDPELEVVGEAIDGAEGVKLTAALRPDVITMDLHMPVMDGLEATRAIMASSPTPIVMVSSSGNRENLGLAFQALEAGALTVLEKPRGAGFSGFAGQAATIVTTVKLMAGVKVVGRRRRSAMARASQPERRAPSPSPSEVRIEIVAIAASTGGPAALAHLLGAFPANPPIPILVVQHISRGFDQGLADWLDGVAGPIVRLAEHGERLQPGVVIVAPHDVHLGVAQGGTVVLSQEDPIGPHRPSATFLFRSAAKVYGRRALGVILTGMGNDGAEGLAELHRAGGHVIAQDDETAVVAGMPRAAVALGAVDEILSLDEIGAAMARSWSRGRVLQP